MSWPPLDVKICMDYYWCTYVFLIFGKEIALWRRFVVIKYVHNRLIRDLDLFRIPKAIFNARAIKEAT